MSKMKNISINQMNAKDHYRLNSKQWAMRDKILIGVLAFTLAMALLTK